MKKFLFSLIFLLVSYVGFSQKGLSYQAVILDPNKIEVPGQDISGQPLVNGDVWMKFSIYNGSALQFEEVHKTKTDNYGLVNLLIGSVSSASFNSLVWDSSQKSLYVYASFDQGGSYTKISEQKLNYNPYALFAETAGKLGGTLAISGGGTGATTAADARANLGLDQVNNTSDVAKPISTATQTALNLKANRADMTSALALKANTADVNAGLALKANATDVTSALDLKANISDVNVSLDLKADTTYVLAKVAAATIADADANTKGKIKIAGDLGGTADAPTVPGLALKANTTDVNTALDLKANSADMTSALALKANEATVATSLNLKENAANKSLNVNSDGTSDVKYPSVKAVKDYVDARVQSGVSSASIADADANTKGKIQLGGDLGGTATIPTVPGLALKANAADVTTLTTRVNTNTASITSNISAISAEAIRATAAELALANNVTANTASITANSTAINSKAPLASPSFSGAVTAPIYASTPQPLTDASTINWNPSQGLNASVTLGGNRTLSFSATPATGSYGTLVLTQDATGGRTITLPSTTNKVLGSTSSTTIDLSTAANAIDIVNFYYDGTNYYWNIGQGYGQAVSSGSTNLASGVTGTLPVANGGTGATTASAARTNLGLVIGTNVQAPLVAGTDYLAPNGSAANLTNFPTFNQNTTGNAATATLATTATTATNATTAGNITATSNTTLTSLSNLTTVGTITSGTWSGTAVAVANGGTGATTQQAAINALTGSQSAGKYLRSDGTNASLTTIQVADVPALNQNTTGNAATATLAGNITATSNTTLTSLSNLSTVGTITSGTISLTTDIKTTSTLTAGTVTYPNTHGTANQVLSTTGSGTLTWTTPSSGSSNTHSVGESYGGGVVFYTWDNGNHGLIVSNSDLASAQSAWIANTTIIKIKPLFDYDGLLAGKEFTRALVYYGLTGSANYLPTTNTAAYLCYQYRGGNFSDWYLPSAYELELLWQNRSVIGNLASTWTSSVYYWSSTLSSDNGTDAVQFKKCNYLGVINGSAGYDGLRVRAIRSF